MKTKVRNMSESSKLKIVYSIFLIIAAILYGLFEITGYDSKFKTYFILGMLIGLVLFGIHIFIKLKRDGVYMDERDNIIEAKASSSSFLVFQLILGAICIITYNLGSIKVNISGLMFILFLITNVIYGIAYLIIKRQY